MKQLVKMGWLLATIGLGMALFTEEVHNFFAGLYSCLYLKLTEALLDFLRELAARPKK